MPSRGRRETKKNPVKTQVEHQGSCWDKLAPCVFYWLLPMN